MGVEPHHQIGGDKTPDFENFAQPTKKSHLGICRLNSEIVGVFGLLREMVRISILI